MPGLTKTKSKKMNQPSTPSMISTPRTTLGFTLMPTAKAPARKMPANPKATYQNAWSEELTPNR